MMCLITRSIWQRTTGKNLRDIEELHSLSKDPSFYVQNASITDPSLAPAGQSTLYVLLPVTHETSNIDRTRETP
jgi:phytoene desaturase